MCGGPGPKAPSPRPLPSSPNEVGISPQLLRPGAWVSPEASPAPCACPSAPAWPVSASRMGFPGRCESCPGATSHHLVPCWGRRQPVRGASSAARGAMDQLPPETISLSRTNPHPGSPSQQSPESSVCRRNAESSPGFRSLSVTPGNRAKAGPRAEAPPAAPARPSVPQLPALRAGCCAAPRAPPALWSLGHSP